MASAEAAGTVPPKESQRGFFLISNPTNGSGDRGGGRPRELPAHQSVRRRPGGRSTAGCPGGRRYQMVVGQAMRSERPVGGGGLKGRCLEVGSGYCARCSGYGHVTFVRRLAQNFKTGPSKAYRWPLPFWSIFRARRFSCSPSADGWLHKAIPPDFSSLVISRRTGVGCARCARQLKKNSSAWQTRCHDTCEGYFLSLFEIIGAK